MFELFRKRLRNRKGFTLVELLVVIAIIGILIAIAVPSYSKIRANAEKKACEANMRTIYGAVQVYSIEVSGPLPNNIDLQTIQDYFDNKQPPKCPTIGKSSDYTVQVDPNSGTITVTCTKHGTYPSSN